MAVMLAVYLPILMRAMYVRRYALPFTPRQSQASLATQGCAPLFRSAITFAARRTSGAWCWHP
jgi:hypothetical protein